MSKLRTFRDVKVGERFHFASESQPGYEGARGPWIKLGIRRFRLSEEAPSHWSELRRPEHTIGSLNVVIAPSTIEDAINAQPRRG